MDKRELIKTLHEQAANFEQQVRDRYVALQDGNLGYDYDFSSDESSNSEDDDFASSFIDNSTQEETTYSSAPGDMSAYYAPKVSYEQPPFEITEAKTETNSNSEFQNHKMSVMERINALRGVSQPGDYLRRKQ